MKKPKDEIQKKINRSNKIFEAETASKKSDGFVKVVKSKNIEYSSRSQFGITSNPAPSVSRALTSDAQKRIFDFSKTKSSSYNIIPEIYGVSNMGANGVQRNIENAHKLVNLKDGQAYIGIISDMEWLGKGHDVTAMPTEFGFVPVLITKDGLKPLTENAPVDAAKNSINNPLGFKAENFGIGIYDTDAKTVEEMIDKLEKGQKLNQTEYRTLKDLASYGKDVDLDPQKRVIGRGPSSMLIDGQDLTPYKDQIRRGYELLSTSKKAMARNEVNLAINEQIDNARKFAEKNGYSVEGNMFAFHNGINADLKAIKESFGEDSDLYKMVSNNTIDTLSLSTMFGMDSPSRYKDAGAKGVKGFGTLDSQLRIFAPERAGMGTAHVGGDDAIDLAYLLNGMLNNKELKGKIKNAKLHGDALNVGDKLFSINHLSKYNIGASPIDSLYEMTEDGPKYINYHNYTAYKHSMFEIKNEFTEVVDGKKYFGMVLHNTDDDVYSVIARENVDELRDVVQRTFKRKENIKNFADIRKQSLDDKARRAYRSIFTDQNSFYNFNKYVSAAEGFSQGKSIDELGLSKAQKRNFMRIKDRLVEELPFLNDFKSEVLDKIKGDQNKSVALNMYYDTFVPTVYGGSQTYRNTEDIYLPNTLFKNGTAESLRWQDATEVSRKVLSEYTGAVQGKVYNPRTMDMATVNLQSIDAFTQSINNTIAANTSRNPNLTMADGLKNLEEFVLDLNNTNVIEESKAKKLMSIMANVDSYQGYGSTGRRGLHRVSREIAESIHGDVLKWNMRYHLINKVYDQERLRVDRIANKDKALEVLRGTYKEVKQKADNYFASGLMNPATGRVEYGAFRNPEAQKALERIDDYQRKYVGSLVESVRTGKVEGPMSLIDNLNELARAYYKEGMVIDVAREQNNSGLIMSIYDKNLAEGTMKKAQVRIPLLDVSTGMIEFQGRQNSNVLRPVRVYDHAIGGYTNKLRVDTYLNKAMESLVYKKTREDITDLIRAGDIDKAQAYLNRSINAAISSIPGSTSTLDGDDILIRGSRLAHTQKSAMIDTNDLYYQTAKMKGFKNKSIQDFRKEGRNAYLRETMYSDDAIAGLYGGRSEEGQAMRDALSEIFGGRYYASPLKAERVKEGFLSAMDNREFVSFGQFADVGRENIRQRANYVYLGKYEDIAPGKNRMDVIRRYAGERTDRYTRKLVGSERYFGLEYDEKLGKYEDSALRGVEEGLDGINLKTAIVNDFEVADMLRDEAKTNKTGYILRPHVHDDTVFMKAEIAEALGYMEERKVLIDIDDKIVETLGSAVKGETILSADDHIDNVLYGNFRKYGITADSVFDSISYNSEKESYELTVKMLHHGKEGMKIGTAGGNKATARLLNTYGWEQMFKKEYHDLDMIANFDHKKMPQDLIDAQLRHFVYEMDTVGKASTREIQDEVRNIVRRTFTAKTGNTQSTIDDTVNAIRVINGKDGKRLILPNRISGRVNLGSFVEEVNNALVGRNLEGVKRNGHLVSLINVQRADVNDVYNTFGSTSGEAGVKIGLREVEMFGNRKYLDGNPRTDRTVDLLKRLITQNAGEHQEEALNMMNTLLDAGGNEILGGKKYTTLRTRGSLDLKDNEMLFRDVNVMPSKGPYTKGNLRGTIMDPNKFEGGAFFLELTEDVKIDEKRTINRLLMPVLPAEGMKDDIYLNEVQKTQKRIFDNIMTITTMDESDPTQGRLIDKARRSLYGDKSNSGLVQKYIKQVGDSALSSKGNLYEKLLTTRVDSAVQLKFAATSPIDAMLGLDTLDEGSVLLSKGDMQKMLGKLPESEVNSLIKKAQTEGIVGMGLRYPTTQFGSIQTVKYRVMTDEMQKAADLAGIDLSGKAYVTVGTQARWSADFDGDSFSGFLPQLAGRKAKVIDKAVQAELEQIHKIERRWDKDIAKDRREKIAKDASVSILDQLKGASIETIDSVLDDASRFAEVESRILKDVGALSNMSMKYRRMAEVAGGLSGNAETIYPMINAFGTSFEQLSISSKQFGQTVGDLMKKEGYDSAVAYAQQYISSYAGLIEGMEKLDPDAIIEHSKVLGIFDKNTGMFSGSVKSEGDIVNRTFKDGNFSARDLHRALYEVKDYNDMLGNEGGLWNSYVNFGISKQPSASSALDMVEALISTDSNQSVMSGYTGADVGKRILFGDNIEGITEEHVKARLEEIRIGQGVIRSSGSESVTRGLSEDMLRTKADNIIGAISSAKSHVGMAVGASLAGMWAVGRVFGGIQSGVKAHRGEADQAPSSDGEYVDPAYYAGAPEGAGPTARLAERGTGYERMNINISGNSMSGMTNEEIASLVSEEIQRQSGLSMNINVNSQDDRTSLDKNWLQQQFALALDTGYSY